MDRVAFISSINGIAYPKMIVDFFDHFLALKQIVDNTGQNITIVNKNEKNITFDVEFNHNLSLINAIHTIETLNGVIEIYRRPIYVYTEVLSDKKIRITLS